MKYLSILLLIFSQASFAHIITKKYDLKTSDCLASLKWDEDGLRGVCDVNFHEAIRSDFALPGQSWIGFSIPMDDFQVDVSVSPQPSGYRMELSSDRKIDINAVAAKLAYVLNSRTKTFEVSYYTLGNSNELPLQLETADHSRPLSFPVRLEDCLEGIKFSPDRMMATCLVKFDVATLPKGMVPAAASVIKTFKVEDGEDILVAIKPLLDGYRLRLYSFDKPIDLGKSLPWLQHTLLYTPEISAQMKPKFQNRCLQFLTRIF